MYKIPSSLCVSGCPLLKIFNQLINFRESWYEHYLIKGHANAVYISFLVHSVNKLANAEIWDVKLQLVPFNYMS